MPWGVWLGAAGRCDLGAVEVIARAQVPVPGFTGQVKSPALRHGVARRRELRTKRHIGAGGAGIEHRWRVPHGPVVCDLVIHREGALGVALHEAQVPFDDIAVGQIAVRKTVEAENRGSAAAVSYTHLRGHET